LQKILVVDDEHNIRQILDFSLDAEGFQVIGAADGEEAFETAVAQAPDLVILDVMMPRGDGIEVCRRLKEDPRTKAVPVILLTACAARGDRERGLAAGADDYIIKPFSPQKVVDRVFALLGVRH
jgi:two-component system, OmpR family, alkaline phosphatase synthesis response regulator PhoP